MIDINLVKKLQELAIKFNITDLKLICKDVDGKMLFLEIGNSNAELTHIIERHWNPKELIKYFNSQDEMIEKIFNTLKNGKYIAKEIVLKNGRESFEYTYKMNVIGGEKLFKFAIGSNGFIITFYLQ